MSGECHPGEFGPTSHRSGFAPALTSSSPIGLGAIKSDRCGNWTKEGRTEVLDPNRPEMGVPRVTATLGSRKSSALCSSIDKPVLRHNEVIDPKDRGSQRLVTMGPVRQPDLVGPPGQMFIVGCRGDWQHAGKRLKCVRVLLRIDETVNISSNGRCGQ